MVCSTRPFRSARMYSKGDFLKRVIIISHAQLRQHMLENGLLSYLLTSPSDGCDLFLCSYEYIIMRFIFSEYTDFSESHTVLSIGSSSVMDFFSSKLYWNSPITSSFWRRQCCATCRWHAPQYIWWVEISIYNTVLYAHRTVNNIEFNFDTWGRTAVRDKLSICSGWE